MPKNWTPWTPDEEQRALDLRFGNAPHRLIAERLGRPLDSVRHKLARLNAGVARSKFRHWTKIDARRLRRLYPQASWQELERAFPERDRRAISAKAQKLGVVRTRVGDALEERQRIAALSEEEAAYLAGLVDGEGSIMFTNSHLVLSLGSTNKPVIEWLELKLGGHSYFYARGSGMGTKPFWRWALTKGRAAQAAVGRMRPYLIIKADVADSKLGISL